MRAKSTRGISTIAVTASLSLAVLLVTIAWRTSTLLKPDLSQTAEARAPAENFPTYGVPLVPTDSDGDGVPDWQEELLGVGIQAGSTTASSADVTALQDRATELLINGYLTLKQYNAFSADGAERVGTLVANSIQIPVEYEAHTRDALQITSNTSLERVLRYRTEMQTALGVLVTDHEPEFLTFARYVESGDDSKLAELKQAAERYRTAEQSIMKIVVPEDTADIHVRVANALGMYAYSIDQLIRYSSDPFGTAAAIRTYNESENELYAAFQAHSAYYVRKSSRE